LSAVPQLFAQTDWLYRQPGLEKIENDAWRPVDWRNYKSELEILVQECISEFRLPFELPEGARIVPGEDDKELTKERTFGSSCTLVGYGGGKIPPPDTRVPHEAIDVGSRITRDDGKTLEKLGNAPVRAVHPGGFVRTKSVYPEQKVVCQQGLFRLIIVIEYGHVTPDSRIGTEWQPTPHGNLGQLRGRDSWRCLDPYFSKQMPDKGNHIHLTTEGIYDLDGESFIAHNQQIKGHNISPEHEELLRRRANFFNNMLLPKVTGLE